MSLRGALMGLGATVASAAALAAPPPSRGELLYTTHCIACHSTQLHWRDGHRATDWPSLKAQVQRWQGTAQLRWSDADVTEVTRYLNDAFYRFAAPERSAALRRDALHP